MYTPSSWHSSLPPPIPQFSLFATLAIPPPGHLSRSSLHPQHRSRTAVPTSAPIWWPENHLKNIQETRSPPGPDPSCGLHTTQNQSAPPMASHTTRPQLPQLTSTHCPDSHQTRLNELLHHRTFAPAIHALCSQASPHSSNLTSSESFPDHPPGQRQHTPPTTSFISLS